MNCIMEKEKEKIEKNTRVQTLRSLLRYEMERNEMLSLKLLKLEEKNQELRRQIKDLECNPTWTIV